MALTQDTPVTEVVGPRETYPVAAAVKIYRGAMLGFTSGGHVRPLTAGDRFAGHAYHLADNSTGAAADTDVQALRGVYRLSAAVTSAVITSIGDPVYASDDATLTLTNTGTYVGRFVKFDSAGNGVVEFEAPGVVENLTPAPVVVEVDCEADTLNANQTLIPAEFNPKGFLVTGVYGIITEVFGGASEDQGVITVEDSAGNAIATLTAGNAAVDVVNDVIKGYAIGGATSGDAAKVVAAGAGIRTKLTQKTAGAGAAGKMRVYVMVEPLTT